MIYSIPRIELHMIQNMIIKRQYFKGKPHTQPLTLGHPAWAAAPGPPALSQRCRRGPHSTRRPLAGGFLVEDQDGGCSKSFKVLKSQVQISIAFVLDYLC